MFSFKSENILNKVVVMAGLAMAMTFVPATHAHARSATNTDSIASTVDGTAINVSCPKDPCPFAEKTNCPCPLTAEQIKQGYITETELQSEDSEMDVAPIHYACVDCDGVLDANNHCTSHNVDVTTISHTCIIRNGAGVEVGSSATCDTTHVVTTPCSLAPFIVPGVLPPLDPAPEVVPDTGVIPIPPAAVPEPNPASEV